MTRLSSLFLRFCRVRQLGIRSFGNRILGITITITIGKKFRKIAPELHSPDKAVFMKTGLQGLYSRFDHREMEVKAVKKRSRLDMLPCELQQLIITSLDDDPYTLLNLPFVSKKWHNLLTTGKRATEEWERRCRKLGAKRKSPLATRSTWYSTFVELASRRCAYCLAHTSCNVGHLLVYGFKYVALCEECQVKNQPGPFQMIPIDHLHVEGVGIARQLLNVPQRTRDRPGRFKFMRKHKRRKSVRATSSR